MENRIRLTWHGHSCFTVECDGYRIVIDPFEAGSVPGFAPLSLEANGLLMSHGHRDHAGADRVRILPSSKPSPFAVTSVDCPHDDANGEKRGRNLIHVMEAGGVRIAHFGDVGCTLDGEQYEKIGLLDGLMIPVGGYYTVGPREAAEIAGHFPGAVVIPMHYRCGAFGYDEIGTVEDFLALSKTVERTGGNTVLISKGQGPKTVLLSLPE